MLQILVKLKENLSEQQLVNRVTVTMHGLSPSEVTYFAMFPAQRLLVGLIVSFFFLVRCHSAQRMIGKNKGFLKMLLSFSIQVVFEGVRGSSYQGDIAVDDIVIKNGSCPPLKACSFEDVQTCGWTNEKR